MTEHLLQTKLHIPPFRPERISRPRLVERLCAGLRSGHKLALLSAPAGSGKTTLLSEYAAGSGYPVAWLSLDEDDNDVSRFWTYLISALQVAGPDLGQDGMHLLQAPQAHPVQSILVPVLNDIAASPGKVLLILDDYHVISAPVIHEGLTFLLDHQPPQLHLAISTRADPPLPIARLRARQQITELRDSDLRFTLAEAATYLNETMCLGLGASDVEALETRTEGWIVGLQLAALSMQERMDRHAFIEAFTGSHRYILEFLTEEVVHRQPESVQRFLIQTSILERLCGSLCDALTGDNNGDAALADLHRRNLFIVSLDDEQRWYRFHHLFADLLRKRLGQSVPPEQLSELHRRASRWHEENGLLEQAVKHAQSAGDFERIAEMAEQAAGDSLLDARLTTLLRWVGVLPKDILRNRPRLQVYRAWALYMNGHLEAAQQALGDCRQGLEALPPSPENDKLRHALTRLLDTIDMIARGLMFSVDNRIQEAIRVCSRAREMALEDGQIFLAAQATEGLALAQYHQGQLRACAESCQQVIDLAAQTTAQAPLAAAGHVELAGVYTEWNDLEAAGDSLDSALALCRQWGIVQTLSEAHTAQSRLLQASGDIEGAWEALRKGLQVSYIEGEYSMVNFRLATQRARLNLQVGKLDEVVDWVTTTKAAFTIDGSSVQLPAAFLETLQTNLARAYLCQGRAREALAVLDPLLAPAEAAGGFLRVIEVCALRALALRALDDTSAALASLERSLVLAEPERYVRMYLNEGPPMAHLLREAASLGVHTEYTGKLLAAFTASEHGHIGGPPSPIAPHPHVQPLTEPLTPREVDVLDLISQGLSNKDIGDKLAIALNTVKRHTSSIYGKMGVKSRTQAVARARELGLLPTDQD